MAFKKTLHSEAQVAIIGGDQRAKYPVGFEYLANGHLYKVTETFFNDNTEWRRLRDETGNTEDVTIATIEADLDEAGANAVKQNESLYVTPGDEVRVVNDPSKLKSQTKTAKKKVPAKKTPKTKSAKRPKIKNYR